jgi:diguanylate cyclase
MTALARPARLYIGAVLLAGGLATLAALSLNAGGLERLPLGLLLLACATVAQQFKVKSPKHQSYYTTSIFFFAAALLLRPALLVPIVVVAHAAELVRVRYLWYIPAFNIANFLLCSLAAGAIFRLEEQSAGGAALLIAALAAGLVFVTLNHVLTALVIMWARGVSLSRAGTLDWENLGTDLALISVGGLGALLLISDAWLAPLTLGPLFLIYRSLLVPTLKEEARTDPKTELANMKHWNGVAASEVDRARRFRRPLSVMLADLDLLRDINNRYGHLMGDQMIRRVAEVITAALREYDLPARFGGDEFAILMPETTLPEATAVAERIRRGVEAIEIRGSEGDSVVVSLSVGVAAFPAHGANASELLAAADRAVYQAKALGRNRVCAFAVVESEHARTSRPAAGGRPAVATSSPASPAAAPRGRA